VAPPAGGAVVIRDLETGRVLEVRLAEDFAPPQQRADDPMPSRAA
jgi:hypothetical protein